MKYEHLVFDLDGTLSDPKQGIVRSINYALQCHDFEPRSENELTQYIGPTLDIAFSSLSASEDKQLITSLISKYRERYSDIGYSENVLYPGVTEVLEVFARNQSISLGICTSKRVDFAESILELFSIYHYFNFVNGGDVGIRKEEQLKSLLDQKIINSNSIMIGDRNVDMIAANHNNLQSAGVLWGYGSQKELTEYNPNFIFSSPSEMESLAP